MGLIADQREQARVSRRERRRAGFLEDPLDRRAVRTEESLEPRQPLVRILVRQVVHSDGHGRAAAVLGDSLGPDDVLRELLVRPLQEPELPAGRGAYDVVEKGT